MFALIPGGPPIPLGEPVPSEHRFSGPAPSWNTSVFRSAIEPAPTMVSLEDLGTPAEPCDPAVGAAVALPADVGERVVGVRFPVQRLGLASATCIRRVVVRRHSISPAVAASSSAVTSVHVSPRFAIRHHNSLPSGRSCPGSPHLRGAVHSCVEEERGALFDSGSLRLPGHDAQRNPLTDRVAVTRQQSIGRVHVP